MAEELEPREAPDPTARASIVPRWLAWIVLIVLLGAASLSTWQCATGATVRPLPATERTPSGSP